MKTIETVCQSAWDYHAESIPVPLEDVAEVIAEACTPGDSGFGQEEIVGLFRLKDGRFLYVSGGCDTTGWECQSHVDGTVSESLPNLVRSCVTADDKRVLKLAIDANGTVTIDGNEVPT
jgi:hypothetical protein